MFKLKLKRMMFHRPKINVSWFIFTITILLFLSILMPGLFERYPYYSMMTSNFELPYKLRLYGEIYSLRGERDYSGYTVNVGGYKKNVEKDGKFDFNFPAESRDEVVVVVMDNNDNIYFCSKITFENGTEKYLKIIIGGNVSGVLWDNHIRN